MQKRKVTKHKNSTHEERTWSAEEGLKLMQQRHPNNLMLRSATLEAKRDYDGAIEVIERAIEKKPEKNPLNSYLDDLLRRRRIYEAGMLRGSKKHKTAKA
ncbi:MAG: hypothetical protein KGI06_03490 [Candidatus Micrarchaeota archaeon]|nr:hypothetical protein [Candidatus Micrarchaeota archaeon]